MEVTIEKLDHYGRGIGKINNKTVFVTNALPTERVKIKILKEKKNFCEAEVDTYLSVSQDRMKPICPYFNVCGGCQIMHMPYSMQLAFKENKVKEILQKFASFSNVKPIVGSEKQFYYRNKITLQVSNQVGLYKNKTNEIIPISYCYLISDSMNKILEKLKSYCLQDYQGQIIIKSSENENLTFVDLNKKLPFSLDLPSTSIIQNQQINKGKNFILEKMEDLTFKISPLSFFQVNTKQAICLYKKIREYANLTGKEVVLDLYCGTGTISIFLSKNAKEVIGVEINPSAIEDAKENVKKNNIQNCTFYCMDAKEFTEKVNKTIDVVIVDPPRAGLLASEIADLEKISPSTIIYVSCDPITLARDIHLLEEKYTIVEVTPFDLFPQTYHVECVCLLKLKYTS